jgi:hypothetical protein
MSQTYDTVHDDDMPAEIDFSGGTRGQFYRPGAKLNLPLYLDEQIQTRLAELANAKGVDFSTLTENLCLTGEEGWW